MKRYEIWIPIAIDWITAVARDGCPAGDPCSGGRSSQDRRDRRSAGGRRRLDPAAAQLAAEEINAKGGVNGRKIEIVVYDNHSSAAKSVRAFQRAVNEDKVNAVIASYISEVVLALEPWAARLKTPLITPGAASDVISKNIHKDYEQNKYTFHGYLTSAALALSVCDAAKDLLVDQKMKTAVIMSEDAAWTKPLDAGYEECLPKIGLKVLDHIRFSPDTTDFTPIFNKIEGCEARRDDHRHLACRHAADGAVEEPAGADPDVRHLLAGHQLDLLQGHQRRGRRRALSGRLRPRRRSDAEVGAVRRRLQEEFGNYPSYAGYTSYDEVYYIADAVKRAGSTDADKLVAALEKTDWEGTIGRVAVLRQGRSVHPLDQVRQGPDHRPDAAMAGRQADRRLAEGRRQGRHQVPRASSRSAN